MPSKPQAEVSSLLIIFYAILIFGFSFAAVYFYQQNRETTKKLEFEMSDVRNVASVGSVEGAMRQRDAE
jgi:hypothetical protein